MRATTLLLWAQAVISGLTGLILFISPEAIPASFGLRLTSDAHLLCYFYGATELSLSIVSLAVAPISGPVRRAAFLYFAVVHLIEAAAGAFAVGQGLSQVVLANVGAHVLIALLFVLSLRPSSTRSALEKAVA